jgi:membrane-bound lytic murein transglycosylase D
MTLMRWFLILAFSFCLFGCALHSLVKSENAWMEQGQVSSHEVLCEGADESISRATSKGQPLDIFPSYPKSDTVVALVPETEPLVGPGAHEAPLPDVTEVLGIEEHRRVDFFINYFMAEGRKNFERGLARSTRYLPLMQEIFRDEGLPEQLVYLALIESNFSPYAYSRSKAVGPWQFMAGTGRKFGLRIDWWIDDRRDPVKSTQAAAQYLKYLYEMFGSWDLALAGYNAGEGTIERCVRRRENENFWELCEHRGLKRETKDFVPKFLAATRIAMDPEEYGFMAVPFEEPWQFDVVSISDPLDLETIARLVDATEEEIRELNPQLRRWSSPPGPSQAELRVPKGTGKFFTAGLAKLPPSKRAKVKEHTVKRGESLWVLARRYGSRVDLIQRFNRLSSASRIREGLTLMIPLPPEGSKETVSLSRRLDTGEVLTSRQESAVESNDAGDSFVVHHVKRGDTLWSISRQYGVRIADILRWNTLESHQIRPGDALRVNLKET